MYLGHFCGKLLILPVISVTLTMTLTQTLTTDPKISCFPICPNFHQASQIIWSRG